MNRRIQVMTVSSDVLSKQSNLSVTALSKVLDFMHDNVSLATFFASSYIRNDAICAVIVAAINDGNPGTEVALANDGEFRQVLRQLLKYLNNRLTGLDCFQHQFR